MSFIALTLLAALFAPALAAALLSRVPRTALRAVALGGAGLSLAAAAVAFQAAAQGDPLAMSARWAHAAGISLALRADGVSASLLLLNGLIGVLAILATRVAEVERPRLFLGLLLLIQTGVAGVLLARDMVLFYVFWEAVLVPLFFLIAAFGENRRHGDAARDRAAALKLLIYTGLGSLAMLLSIVALYATEPGPAPSFDVARLAQLHLGTHALVLGLSAADLVFIGFSLAFAFKSPIFPFHGWLADAYTAAPTPALMMLAGVVAKLGPYGLYRLGLELMPAEAQRFSGLLMTLAALGIVYGALLALREPDVKRAVAWISLSHMGFISLGIVGLTAAGLSGAGLQMLNHGILISGLFYAVGHIERVTGERDRRRLGGLFGKAPALAALLLVLSLGTLGLPGLNGFVGEYLIMAGTFSRSGWLLALAAAGVILAAWYMLRLYQGLFNGPAPAAEDGAGPRFDLTALEAGVLVPLAALTVVIGLYPAPLLDAIGAGVSALTALAGGGG